MIVTEPIAEREYRVRLRRPHAAQRQFIESQAKRKVIRAGRRGGKTVGVAVLALEEFLAGARVLYATPTQEQVEAFWYEVKCALTEPLDAEIYIKNETRHSITFPGTKQCIRAKTAWNADTLRGDYADILIMDEFQLMAESAWEEVGAPMLIDNDGDAIFIYTPPSLRTRGTSKAQDPRYCSKLYARAAADTTGRWEAFHFASHANPYISRDALSDIAQDMTALGYRQEIEAEDIEDAPGALWKRAQIEADRIARDVIPEMKRIVVAVDPSCSATGDEAGVVVCGIGVDKQYYLLEDASLQGTPDEWARAAVSAYGRWDADALVYEANQGGLMVATTLRTVDATIPLRAVHASRGKMTRAEPVAALSEQHKIHHVGYFAFLEDELCYYTGTSNQASPNRLDAYVYAMTDLYRRQPAVITVR